MPVHQGPRRHAHCQIIVHGMQDVTSKLSPYLISVQVIDALEGGADECHIELDDRNGELQIPPDGVSLQVALGWAGEGPRLFDAGRKSEAGGQGPMQMSLEEIKQEAKFGGPGLRLVFDGWVSNVESGFGRRGGGRRMWIEGKGHNDKGLNKQVMHGFLGEGKEEDGQDGKKIPLKDVMTKVFGAAGLQVAMSEEMGKITRDYWSWRDSPMNFGQRMANEAGGLFKISGKTAIMIAKNGTTNATGDQMPLVEAVWGVNLIGWRIKPYVGRPQYGQAASRHFDVMKGVWETVKGSISASTPHGGTEAIAHAANSVADKGVAEQTNKGTGGDTQMKRGTGWVLLNGEPNCKAGGFITIEGARPGIDGMYKISAAEHNYTRGVGYTTRCQVTHPYPRSGSYGWKQNDTVLTEQYGPPSPLSGNTNLSPEEIERLVKQQDEDRRKREEEGEAWDPNLGVIAPPAVGQPPPLIDEGQPGQGGEGGIAFPQAAGVHALGGFFNPVKK